MEGTKETPDNIILHEDTLWTNDVLLGEGNVVTVVSGVTLTIKGTLKKPVRVVFQSTRHTPYISLFPSATWYWSMLSWNPPLEKTQRMPQFTNPLALPLIRTL